MAFRDRLGKSKQYYFEAAEIIIMARELYKLYADFKDKGTKVLSQEYNVLIKRNTSLYLYDYLKDLISEHIDQATSKEVYLEFADSKFWNAIESKKINDKPTIVPTDTNMYNVTIFDVSFSAGFVQESKEGYGEIDKVIKLSFYSVADKTDFLERLHIGLGKFWLARHGVDNIPSIFYLANNGWKEQGVLKKRSIDTIVTQANSEISVLEDIENFKSLEDRYAISGIPYHRGYMLYGVPGTGKTSLVKAVASELNSSLYVLNLTSILNDTQLISAIADVPKNSILLIEDIDSYKQSTERVNNEKFTMAGLLNAFDGVSTPDGLIIFITTNHPENIDPALTRPGRIDMAVELTTIKSIVQANRLFEVFYEQAPVGSIRRAIGMTPAEMYGILGRHMNDAIKGEEALQ